MLSVTSFLPILSETHVPNQVNQYLEAVIELNPDALDIATQLDQERAKGHVRGPLHGIPVLVKDVRRFQVIGESD